MISRNIKPNKANVQVVQAIGGPSFIGRVLLKNVYQQWKGENFVEITQNTIGNPFNLRVGLPQIDKQLKEDRVFLFTKYLSYNPLTKQIEKRELIPLRNVEKVYIGQSPEEHHHTNYKLFVDGVAIVEDILFKQPNQSIGSLVKKIQNLEEKVQILEEQLNKLAVINNKQTTYNI